jgi:hypothetical protein
LIRRYRQLSADPRLAPRVLGCAQRGGADTSPVDLAKQAGSARSAASPEPRRHDRIGMLHCSTGFPHLPQSALASKGHDPAFRPVVPTRGGRWAVSRQSKPAGEPIRHLTPPAEGRTSGGAGSRYGGRSRPGAAPVRPGDSSSPPSTDRSSPATSPSNRVPQADLNHDPTLSSRSTHRYGDDEFPAAWSTNTLGRPDVINQAAGRAPCTESW